MTIFALSSGIGTAGIAVIRISGPDSKNVILKLTKAPFPKPKFATLKKINNINNSRAIDEGIILWFPGPQSYTGEDMAEIHVHGSRAVIKTLLESISQVKGCRLAEPGEFTKVALKNGKIDLLKAESIGDLISAETDIQMNQALKIIAGNNLKRFEEWRNGLLNILSNIEAKIDFPEDDLPSYILKNIHSETKSVKNEIKKILSDQNVGEIIREGFKIAIVGPTNAGKSSLLNYLSKRDVAIVSEIAGTTRDVIEAQLNLDGFPVVISDTAGIREAKDEIEKKGIKLALERAENADLILIVIEPKSIDFTDYFMSFEPKKSILIINKIDLNIEHTSNEIKKYDTVKLSIKQEKNLDKLIQIIKEKLKNKFISQEDIYITRKRHRNNLEKCVEHLTNFEKKNSIEDFDKAAEDLRLATRYLGMIVGKVDIEEILGSIFNDFCIGK